MKRRCMGCMETYNDESEICPNCGYQSGTPSEEAIHMQPHSLLHDRYVVGKVLGYGGFGVTYIAWDGRLEQKVAIKEYLPSEFSTRMLGQTTVTVFNGDKEEQFQSGLDKFIDEAKRIAKFQNEAGIVKVFDTFSENRTAYIVMEYLEGETLASRLKREKQIPEDEAVELIQPILESLKVVHAEGIIHRDIAPDNIFITKDGEVKLIDFGASRFATTSHSRSLTVIIKPGYSPEEQYRSRGDQGPHTDVYAMSAVLYKMITGKTPPDAMERRAKIETKKKDLLEEPHKLVSGISRARENAILNAMNVQIEDRTPDIAAFMAELSADPPVKRRYGKIKKIDLYTWPLWLKIALPTVLVLLIAFGTLLATGVINFKSLFNSEVVVPDQMVVVPEVESMDKDEAIEKLRDLKINVSAIGNVESEFVDVGKVVFQNPNAGTYVYEYGTVYLTISSGIGVQTAKDGVSTVPYVVWDTKDVAILKLREAGLGEPQIIEVHDDSVAAGKIIAQSLDYGTETEEGAVLTLTVSLGPENFIMPNTKEMSQEDAIALLSGFGLNVTVEQTPSSDVEAGHVVGQSIDAGSSAKSGDTVVLSIASVPEETTVATTIAPTQAPKPTNAPKTTSVPKSTPTPAPTVTPMPKSTPTPVPVPGTTETQHTHSYTSTITKNATCGATGVLTYTCSCGDSYTETIPATGNHDYKSEVTVQPEVGKEGVRTYTCTVCGDTYTEKISALGLSDWVEASQVPAGAQIAEEKWTYTLTSYTTATISNGIISEMDGWTIYDQKTEYGSYGSWSNWSRTSVTKSSTRDVETRTVTDRKGYTQWHYWVYRSSDHHHFGTKGYWSDAIYQDDIYLDYKLGLTTFQDFDYYGPVQSEKCSHSWCKYWTNEESTWIPAETHTEYRYRDKTKITTYYFSKTESKEATSDPTGGSGVSDVKKYVKYVVT